MPACLEIPPGCEAAMRVLWDYLARALTNPRMVAVDEHLAQCGICRANAVFEKRLIAEIAAIRRPYDDSATLQLRILRMLSRARVTQP
jgi:hypothetical protein